MSTPFPLGRVVEHDPRSLNFPAAADKPIVTVSWQHYGSILDQGQVGSCTGNAMVDALNTAPLHTPRATCLDETDALRLYARATELDGFPGTYPGQDTGSSGLAAAKAAKEEGLIGSYDHAFGFDHFLAAMMNGSVMLGTNWYQGMFNPNSKGFIEPTGGVAGGHEYEILRVNVRDKYVTGLQSWGRWGLRGSGLFRMSFPTVNRLLSEQGDALQPLR